ncbi:MBG domain-containing protein [Flavobacterium sp. N1994]|uniref:MBG domain-containing protein n=1 Tax=Flavobacterium sp. N1994 TaxID=2986827 RepID=UPI00222155EE|nr:MBG domain-containing protein [Flavobacterium sp. N1994]
MTTTHNFSAIPKNRMLRILFLFLLVFSAQGISAQIALRGTATTASATTTSVTINVPTGVVAGDVMIANFATYKSPQSAAAVTNASWTAISSGALGGNNKLFGTLLYRVATAAEPASYTFSTTAANSFVGAIVAFSGVNTVTPFDVTPTSTFTTSGNTASTSLASITAVTTVTSNAAVLMFGMSSGGTTTTNANFGAFTTTSPASLSNSLYDFGPGTGTSGAVGAAWATKATAGSTGAGNIAGVISSGIGGQIIALRPAKQFRSNATTFNWGTAASWQESTDGGLNWVTATSVPNSSDDLVTIRNGHTVTLAANATASDLTIDSGGTLNTGATFTFGVTGVTSVTGTFTLAGTGAKTFTGDVDINAGGVWNETGVSTYSFAGHFTNDATTFTANTGTHTFSGASKTISGATALAIPTVTFTGSYTNNGTITSNTTLTLTAALTQGATGILNIGGSVTGSLTASAAGNTVNYTGAAQTGLVTTYNNLTLSGSLAKTFATTPTVNGILSLEGTATVSVTSGVVTYGANATLQYNKPASYTATSKEWITPFVATGGIIIKNTGAITTPGAVQVGNNTNVDLNINTGATLTPGANLITLHGDFINGGTLTSGSGGVTIAGTSLTQSIDGFTTTGTVSMTKTAGTATFAGNVNGGGLTINGTGGTLNLGAGLSHTFTGTWTRTAGTLNGGSSTLTLSATPTPISGTGGTFTAGTGTVNYNAAGNQTLAVITYNNLTLSGSGAKTIGTAASGTLTSGNLSIAPTGSATASVTNANISVGSLTVGGVGTVNGTWGAVAATSATNKTNTFFTTGITGNVTAGSDTRTTPTITTAPTATAITYGQTLAASTLSGGVASVAGTFALTTPSTAPNAGTTSQSVTFTPTNAANYSTVITTVSVIVNRIALTVTATGPSKTYGTTLTAGASTTNFSVAGTLVGSETLTSVTLTPDSAGLSATTAANAAYTVTPSVATGTGGFLESNYNISYIDYSGTVATKALTITANNQTNCAGIPFSFSGTEFSTSGLVNGNTVSSVTLTSAGSASSSNASTYPIIAANATGTGLTNYNISYADGSLTVNASPDISNFSVGVTNPVAGGTSTVTINSTSLANGTYTVTYNLTGDNTATGSTASVSIVAGTGTFATSALATAGYTTITITAIKNAATCSSTISSGNTATIVIATEASTTITATGSWTAPVGVTSVTVEAWGAGGAGGGASSFISAAGGGGAGGAYVKNTAITVVPNTTYTVTVGAGGTGSTGTGGTGGDSWFGSTTTVLAKGGNGGLSSSGSGAAGASAISTGNVGATAPFSYYGGAGGNGGTSGGGGGSSAGTGSNGNTATGTAGGGAVTGGGAGANGSTNNANGASAAVNSGGGGAGATANFSTRSGGAGGSGKVAITYKQLTYKSQIISANLGSTSWCSGETRNITVTIKNIGTATWTDGTNGSGTINIGVKWNTNSSNWADYNVRTSANNLAPGQTATYTFTITASNNTGSAYTTALAAGTNNLTFDIVYEGISWFGNNGGGVGPGNTVFTSAAQTILALPTVTSATGNSKTYTGIANATTVSAVASAGATIDWYDAATGGTLLASGTLTYAPTGINAGTYTAYAQARNTTTGCTSAVRTSATLTINKAPLTITAVNQTVSYGTAVATVTGAGTYTATGFVNSETSSVIGGLATYSTTYTPTTAAATASVTITPLITGLTATNYSFSAANGAVTITTAALTVTANIATHIYGATLTPGAGASPLSVTGMQNSETLAGTVTLAYTSGNIATSAVGTYTGAVSPSVFVKTSGTATLSNYTINYVTNNLSVTTASLTITANNASKCFGTTYTFGTTAFTSSGLQNGETIGSVTLTSLGASSAAAAGSYSITPSAATGVSFTAANYSISYIDGALTVTANNTAGAASSTPTLCINTALTAITHTTTGATGIGTAIGLPAGVTAAWATNSITISGTPTASGTFSYTIPLTGGCGTVNATGTITVTPAMTAGAASSTPTLCISTALTAITHATTGATGIGSATGLPTGVSAAWATNTITISGTPTASGTFNYTIPVTGGCGTVNATGTITVTPAMTAGAASSTPTLCISTALTAITHTTSGATGIGTATGLPTGVTAAWATNTITISGTPTASGTFNYTIPVTGGCGTVNATGTITVTPANTAGAASSTPTLCINTALTAITHVTTGATGIGTATGLPAGVTAAWATNTITISGTPTNSGTFTYTIPLTGGCGTVNATGTITVTPAMTAGAASSTPTLCINTALTAITHATTGATGIGSATGLPTGVTAAWATNTITISGTPTNSGTFTYTIPVTGGCGTVNATGTITVTPNKTAGAASSTPTLCINTALTTITHATTGATGIGSATGLPTGVTAAWATNTITISGTPTNSGTFTYTIPLTGGCGTVNATGTITVTPAMTASAASSTPTLCINTALTAITHATTGATGIGSATGLPTGVTAAWATNTITISGTPTNSGTFTYTIPLTGGCGTVNATGTITVTPAMTASAASSTPTLCINTALTAITHATTGATGIGSATGLPTGVTAAWATNTITISGTPTNSGTFTYTIPLTGGCGTVNATGTITVTPAMTASAASSTPTLCINTALTAITHTTTGATGIGTATGLPAGVTAAWASNTITISGTPGNSGTFNYTIPLTGGCGTVNATGTITVTTNKTVSAASSSPTLCINTALTAITHTTTGATGIGTATGLPTGVTAAFANNTITISGTPSNSGTFAYTIPLTGGCGTVNATGTITVTPANTAGAASSTPTLCINTALTAITHATTGATGIGTATGLPAGVTAAWATNTITISGTPTASGTFAYTIPVTGGCGTVNATGTITVTPNKTASAASSTPTLCINTALTAITHTTTGATGIGTATGLPAGVTAAWATNTITISGTPTASGTFAYTIPLTGGCGTVNATGTITVTPANTAGAASSTPTLCINTALTAITHTTTGATGIGTATGLPTGVTAAWATNTITISGTPTASGTFAYTIPVTGGCGTVNATGTITVTSNKTASAGSSTPTLCINTALTAITHTTTGATGIGTATGLPTGVTAAWASNTITISGTPSNSGTFNYSIPLTGGCGTVNATGTITVNPNKTASAGSSTPTLCINTALTAITHTTTGATGIGTATGLPTGVTAAWASNTITISGTPSNSGTFNYSIPLTGGCGTVNATGTITVRSGSTAASITGTAAICSASSTNLQVTITGGTSPYTVVYTSGSVSNYTSGSNISISSTSTTTYNLISVTDANGCVGTGNTGSAVVVIDATTSTDGGITWSNGSPSISKSVIFDGATAIINADFSACSLRLINNAVVTVSPGFDVTLNGKLTVDSGSTFTLSNTANLIQNTTVANSGNIVVKRNSSALKRLDYTLWSSPVTGQGLYAFSPFTLPNRFYYYDTATNQLNNAVGFNLTGLQYPSPLVSPNGVNGTDTNNIQFVNGKSYLIRVPWDHPTTATVWNGSFTGIPNNGDITFGTSFGYNAVGNPYPSRLNVKDFIDGNSNISGPIYIWRKTNGNSNGSYSTLTKTAFVSNGDPNSVTNGNNYFNPGNEANWALNIGQGFIIRTTSGSNITFTNSMRRSSNGDQFFRASQPTVASSTNGLYWLNLNTDTGVFSQMAVGYSSEGTLAEDRGIDGKNINPDFYLTSLIGTDEYSIQGRPDFQDSDIVPLSYKVTVAGNYTITIDHTAGLFSGGTQSIYLKDNLTNTINNLSTGPYAFTSDVGTFTNRFEIIYQSTLGTQHAVFTSNNVIIYNQNNALTIDSGSTIMSSVKIFDIRGRLIEEKKGINANHTTMNGGGTDEVLLVQITSEDGAMVTKKVLFQRTSLKIDKKLKIKTQLAEDE